jgi:IS30 family transposase
MQVSQIESPPAYQRTAPEAHRLHQLGMSQAAIGRRLRVSDKTISKVIKWHLEQPQPSSGWA